MPRALMAVAPRTTKLVEYDEPALGYRDIRTKSEFAAPEHGTESHAYLDDWIQDDPDRVVKLGICFP